MDSTAPDFHPQPLPCAHEPRGSARRALSARIVPAGETAGGTMRETAPRHAGDAPPRRPKLLLAGAWEGTLAVLARHLAQQDVWEISGAATLMEAEARLPETAPDVLVAVWTEEADVTERAATLRQQVPGSRLLVIIVGCPPRHGSASPTQPARGVLCLPRPLKWRTLLLCLDEHWRTLQRKAS